MPEISFLKTEKDETFVVDHKDGYLSFLRPHRGMLGGCDTDTMDKIAKELKMEVHELQTKLENGESFKFKDSSA